MTTVSVLATVGMELVLESVTERCGVLIAA
jgi:hypothetical protein